MIHPFATADCERSFSAMNRIKSGERSRLKDVLNPLMLLYDITPAEKASLDLNKLARELRSNVWKYEKKYGLSAEVQTIVNENYNMMFV